MANCSSQQVAFYFAFTQCYSLFLIFPAVSGVFCWYYCGSYSVTFALCNCLWCVVFVEYWRLKEADLGIRWSVRGVSVLKANRLQYVWDKEVIDSYTGETRKVFSTRKQLLRQTLQIPFAIVSSLALGALIVFTFAMEVFIGEVYEGPFKTYLVSQLLHERRCRCLIYFRNSYPQSFFPFPYQASMLLSPV